MMGLVIRLLSYAVRVFMFILLILLTCLSHLVNTRANGRFANVIPLFEDDNRQLKENYRPVSLLPNFSKICERVAFFHLYYFLMELAFFINSSRVLGLVTQ